MKLSIISPATDDACFIYRGFPWTKLPGIEVSEFSGKVGFNLWRALSDADAVLLQRPFTAQQVSIAQTIKAAGKKLLVDWDDRLDVVPPWNPNKKHFENCEPQLKQLAQLADAVTVSSTALANKVADWGGKYVALVPNAIEDSYKTMQPKPQRNPIVLWRGSSTHSADLETGREYFTLMNRTHEIVFFGDAPAWAYTLRHRHFAVSDYCNYLTTMNALAPEWVAVPLVDHPFNHAKSDIGAQEAYLIGAKLWHNGVGEFARLPESQPPRWLSEVNHIRKDLLCSLL